jgi:hypothetical protein
LSVHKGSPLESRWAPSNPSDSKESRSLRTDTERGAMVWGARPGRPSSALTRAPPTRAMCWMPTPLARALLSGRAANDARQLACQRQSPDEGYRFRLTMIDKSSPATRRQPIRASCSPPRTAPRICESPSGACFVIQGENQPLRLDNPKPLSGRVTTQPDFLDEGGLCKCSRPTDARVVA